MKMTESEVGTRAMPQLDGNGAGAYQVSFGNLPNGYKYFSPPTFSGQAGVEVKALDDMYYDKRTELKSALDRGLEAEFKALTANGMGAGTAGKDLIPVYVDQRIVDRSRKFTPWAELVPRVTNIGLTADYNIITAKGAGVTAAEDAALSDVSDTVSRETASIKYLYSVGRVTGPVQSSMPSYMLQGLNPAGTGTDSASFGSPIAQNAMQEQVLIRAQAYKELEENLIWSGDDDTDATQFNGIVDQQSTTNVVDKSAAALDFADIDTAINYAFTDSGRPSIAGCDSASLKDVRAKMLDQFRYTPSQLTGTAGFGVPARVVVETMQGPIPFVPSQYLSATTGAKQIFFLDMEYIEMRVLQDMTYERLAKVNDSEKFMLKGYETLLLRAPAFNAFIDNIA